jgi:hypothetical protein
MLKLKASMGTVRTSDAVRALRRMMEVPHPSPLRFLYDLSVSPVVT